MYPRPRTHVQSVEPLRAEEAKISTVNDDNIKIDTDDIKIPFSRYLDTLKTEYKGKYSAYVP